GFIDASTSRYHAPAGAASLPPPRRPYGRRRQWRVNGSIPRLTPCDALRFPRDIALRRDGGVGVRIRSWAVVRREGNLENRAGRNKPPRDPARGEGMSKSHQRSRPRSMGSPERERSAAVDPSEY